MILLRKIVNVALALILLVATTGVTLSKHYCMGRLKSVAINEHASHCFKSETDRMPCCEDVEEELKVEEITTSSFDVDLSPDLYQIASITFVLLHQTSQSVAITFPLEESPPLPDQDIQVLYQSFLI